jgi:DNA-directed RNA polymerase subunit RPC12/RpoP
VAVTEFTCASCGETFDRDPDWTAEDAKDEYERAFGRPVRMEDVGVVCDDCHRKIMDWAKRKGLLP